MITKTDQTTKKEAPGFTDSNRFYPGQISFFNAFRALFLLDCRRFPTKRNLLILAAVFITLILCVNHDINRYKELPAKIQAAKKIHHEYFKAIKNYDEYVYYGLKILFIPETIGVLFQNTTLNPDIKTKVDSIVKLQILESRKGKAAGKGIDNGRVDFSCLVLWFVSILSLLYGFESMETREYLLSLASLLHRLKLFTALVLSRFLIFAVSFLTVFAGILLFINARGLTMTGQEYRVLAGYALVTLLMALFFIILGTLIGTISYVKLAIITMLGAVILFNVLIPRIIQTAVENVFPDNLQDDYAEMEKFRIVSSFESQAEQNKGQFKRENIKTAREVIEEYKTIHLAKMKEREEQLMEQFKQAVDKANKLALLAPTSFYFLTANEASSKGYGNFLQFYEYGKEMWIHFVFFWIDRVFFNDHRIVVDFRNGEDYNFKSRPFLPSYFGWGLAILLAEIILLFLLAYSRFNRWLYPATKDNGAYTRAVMNLETGKHYTICAARGDFHCQFINTLSGHTRVQSWPLTIDGKEPAKAVPRFFFVPNFKQVPGDIRARDLLKLFAGLIKSQPALVAEIMASLDRDTLNTRFHCLEPLPKALVLAASARLMPVKAIIIHDTVRGVPDEDISRLGDVLGNIKAQGATLIDLVYDHKYWGTPDDSYTMSFGNGQYTDVKQNSLIKPE